jgi:signal transduction histidine kinase
MADRQLDDARRLERQLIVLRWVVAAFGTVQVWFALQNRGPDSDLALPLGSGLVAGLVVGNLLIARAVRGASTVRRMRSVGWVAYALDATVVMGLLWISSNGRGDPVWVVGYLLPLEAAARWGIVGAMIGASLLLGGEVLRELDVAARHPLLQAGWPTIGFRAGMAYVVAAVVGVFASSLRREASLADERATEAQAIAARAEESARREREARSEVAAFHAAVLAMPESERLPQTLGATAEAIARELGCEALGLLVREPGLVGETALAVVATHGDPGYLPGERLFPTSHPVAAAAMEGAPVLAGRDAVAPMVVRGEIVGALHEHARVNASPDEERLLLLSRLADQLGLVLESARLRRNQEETVRRLRELDEMKTDFVAITSHELRTPLSGIRGFVDMLRRRGDELRADERAEFLDIVLIQTDRLQRLVDDLLVVSRVEAGELSLEPQETELRPFVERVVRAIGDDAGRVRVSVGPEAPSRMVVDARRLAQILTNLVHNALKFSPPETEVEVSWDDPSEGTVAFLVSDRGPGIAADELPRIFDRFHQTERSIEHTEGFGLGLYITKLLAEAMGGWVDVRSSPGAGATFTVTLPAARNLPVPARPSAAERSG